MWVHLAFAAIMLIASGRQRQRSRERAAVLLQTGEVTLPKVFLRHPEQKPSAWICGTVRITHDEPPTWRAMPDIADSRAILDPARYYVANINGALSVSIKAEKPGFAEMRLESGDDAIELLLPAGDAHTLAGRFPLRPRA